MPLRTEAKSLLLLAMGFVLLGVCGLSGAFLFPNQRYYESGNTLEVGASLEGLSFFMSPRFLLPTVWTYPVKDPLIAALIKTESNFVLHSISSSYALGVYQMKPFFASDLGIWNPFFPWNEKKIFGYLEGLQTKYGSLRTALTIYHHGESGYLSKQKISGQSEMLFNYAEKIEGFQRQYSGGQKVRLKDYFRIGLEFSASMDGNNLGQLIVIAPTAWFGTSAVVWTIADSIRMALYQEFMISSRFQIYAGYDGSPVIGCCFRSQTWRDSLSIRYDIGNQELFWEGRFEMRPWFFSLSGTVQNVAVSCGYIFNNQYHIVFGLTCGAFFSPSLAVKAVF